MKKPTIAFATAILILASFCFCASLCCFSAAVAFIPWYWLASRWTSSVAVKTVSVSLSISSQILSQPSLN